MKFEERIFMTKKKEWIYLIVGFLGAMLGLFGISIVQSVCAYVVTFRIKNDKYDICLLVNCIGSYNYNIC